MTGFCCIIWILNKINNMSGGGITIKIYEWRKTRKRLNGHLGSLKADQEISPPAEKQCDSNQIKANQMQVKFSANYLFAFMIIIIIIFYSIVYFEH